MESVFLKSKWIWPNDKNIKDSYGEFKTTITKNNHRPYILRVSFDTDIAIFINGKNIFFNDCSDYANYKFYDEIDISSYLKDGDNEIVFDVYYAGEDSQRYIKDLAGLLYEIENDGNVIDYSNLNTLSRRISNYKENYQKLITFQLGFSFYYDSNVKEENYSNSIEINKKHPMYLRNIKPLQLMDREDISIDYLEDHYLIDLHKEMAGFLELDFESNVQKEILISYGEHINDGKVRRKIGNRDFSVEYVSKPGTNKYINFFRRLAGRYLEIYVNKEDIKINYIGIRNVFYPTITKEYDFEDKLLNEIYKVSIDTLKLCMHEHYEDCPWREQDLYTMDSRNQMLCGYYGFENGNLEYARHNLIIIGKGIGKDGMLSIASPSVLLHKIPFFSLIYIQQIYEYIEFSNDLTILDEVKDSLEAIYNAFYSRIDKTGLIPNYKYPYWNFYEWTKNSDNENDLYRKEDEYTLSYDFIINAYFLYITPMYNKLMNKKINLDAMKTKIEETFYRFDRYILSTNCNDSTMLTNSIAILANLKSNGLDEIIMNDNSLTEASLSMKAFVYDALLKKNKNNAKYVIENIKEVYKEMLDAGATTFWETRIGADDFVLAGSLCHGWSAIPVYYLKLLVK